MTMCRCNFDSSNMKQMRDFSSRQREPLSRFSQEANQALEDQPVNFGNIRRMDARRATGRLMYRTALHAEDASQQQNHEYAGPHRHLTGLVFGNTAISRDV